MRRKLSRKQEKKGFIALDIGPHRKTFEAAWGLGFEEAYRLFSDVVKIGAREGLILF